MGADRQMTRVLLWWRTSVSPGFPRSRRVDHRTPEWPASLRVNAPAVLYWVLHPCSQIRSDHWVPPSRSGRSKTYPTRAAAAQAKSARGVHIEAFDKVWLVTIAEAGWRSPGGTHVAEIGPLPTMAGTSVHRAVHGGRAPAGHEVTGAPALRSGSVVHAERRNVPRDARRHADGPRGRQ